MATISSASLSTPAHGHAPAKPLAEFRAFWRQFLAKAFNPYRPELHYMRGPGPAWRAKHTRPARTELPGILTWPCCSGRLRASRLRATMAIFPDGPIPPSPSP